MKIRLAALVTGIAASVASGQAPPGRLVDIGGQRLHLNCTGNGRPTVLLESGTGDISVIWALVQPEVASFTRVCSYDRGGYAWSDPGTRPRTFAQLSLEIHTALERANERGPFVLVGQSYGGLVVRGFARDYPRDVAGIVLVDAAHEDQHTVYGGQPHLIKEGGTGRRAPAPSISLDTALLAKAAAARASVPDSTLPAPLNRLPQWAQRAWVWSEAHPITGLAQQAELEWSREELVRMHDERLRDRATLGDTPLIVLARTVGGYASGMNISADSLERERRGLQADLARLSRRGAIEFAANSGHNIHLKDPRMVVAAIRRMVDQARQTRPAR